MIRAVVFDCFGVLTSDGWKLLREEMFADNPQKLQQALDLDKAVNSGILSMQNFLKDVSELTNLSVDEVKRHIGSGSQPNRLLFEYIRSELKPKYKIGMLSNAADNWLDTLFEPWQAELFDDVLLSYEVNLVKPEVQIYEMMLNRLGVRADECIFIDDVERYCVAAVDLGIHTIYHTDTNETIQKIEELTRA